MVFLSVLVMFGVMMFGVDVVCVVKGLGEEFLVKRLEEEAKSRERIDALYCEL